MFQLLGNCAQKEGNVAVNHYTRFNVNTGDTPGQYGGGN